MYQEMIGETAGLIWKVLGQKEKVSVSTLAKLVDREAGLVQHAVGWLAREHKVDFEKQGKTLFVKLNEHETKAYQAHATNGR